MSRNNFELVLTDKAALQLDIIEKSKDKKNQCKAVHKVLGLMETNLRHPSLNTHEFTTLKGSDGQKVFESYAQNHTPGAYRIFWHYGPQKDQITVVAIIPHPN